MTKGVHSSVAADDGQRRVIMVEGREKRWYAYRVSSSKRDIGERSEVNVRSRLHFEHFVQF